MAQPNISDPLRLRQWFDEAAQLQHHFHRRDGDEVLFFAGPNLCTGAAVLLEVAFRDSDQVCGLRGRVAKPDQSGLPGSWLSFAGSEVIRGLIDAAATRRRRGQRVPTELVINARAGPTVFICKLVDVSSGGARLSGLRGVVRPGIELDLSLFGKSPALGRIDGASLMWVSGSDAGVRFHRASPEARQAVSRLVAEARQGWATAVEAAHPVQCRCALGMGNSWGPTVPRSSARAAS